MASRFVVALLAALAVGVVLAHDKPGVLDCETCLEPGGHAWALLDGSENALCVPQSDLDKSKVWWMVDDPAFCGAMDGKVLAKQSLDKEFGQYLAENFRAGAVLEKVKAGHPLRRIGTKAMEGDRFHQFTLMDFSRIPAPWRKEGSEGPAIARPATRRGIGALDRVKTYAEWVERSIEEQTLEDLKSWMTKAHAQYEFWSGYLYKRFEEGCAREQAKQANGGFRGGRGFGGGNGGHRGGNGGHRGRAHDNGFGGGQRQPQKEKVIPESYDIYYILKLGSSKQEASTPEELATKKEAEAKAFSDGLAAPPLENECKKMYRLASLQYHPDKLREVEGADEFFKILNAVNEITQDTKKKTPYDNFVFEKRKDPVALARAAESHRLPVFNIKDVKAALRKANEAMSQFEVEDEAEPAAEPAAEP